MSDAPPLHPDLQPLLFLLGSWKGKGEGSYPGIDDFTYLEVATFTQMGKPFIAYTQRTRDASTGAPLHTETGYIRPTGPGRAEFVVAQPTGIVEVHDVIVSDSTMRMHATTVTSTPTATHVEGVNRQVTVQADEMHYLLDMAATGHPMQRHLEATLTRS